ncbi:hypothetical protein Plec18167_007884 [Paecilomyces lecythidis]|uniref:Uncharacterized protein n=1 Tax=Paecilomyces lecythidis TaxID=3004212 RepID=A0ABR3X0J8_9EURO
MPEVDDSLQGDLTRDKLDEAWKQSKGRYRLIKAVFRAYLWPALSGIVPRLMLSGFTFCQPFLITSTVEYFNGDSRTRPREYAHALVGAFLIVYLGIAISTAVYWRQTFRLGTMLRAGLISTLYQKTTLLGEGDVKGSAVLTLMGTDVERIVNSFRSLHEIWASIIEVAVALYLLQRQVSLACIVPAIISLACVFGAGPISARTAPAQKAWIERVEERVAVTSSMLKDMKSVKMLGLIDVFFRLITRLRVAELKTSSRFRMLFIWTVLLSYGPTNANPQTEYADKLSTSPAAISFLNVDIAWSSDSEAILQNLTLEIGKGITMIVGPVGSGKSALIKSILGEMSLRKGSIHIPFRNIAYCSQIPWIVDDTIRHNITGGTEFNAAWYNFVVSTCTLDDDFQSLPAGDMHVAGSRGASLSGGQKQRVALARAIYSRLPVLLLDDIFNGLDSKRISDISTKLFAKDGYFRTAGKTVILATHTDSLLQYSDNIVTLDHGAVVYRGSYEKLINRTSDAIINNPILPQEEIFSPGPDKAPAEEIPCDTTNYTSGNSQKEREVDFSRRDGSWEVYRYYIRSAGPWISAVFVASFIVSTFFSTFSTLWIQWWSESNAKEPNEKVGWYLGFYTAFTVVSILAFFLGCYLLLIHIINDTALTLHTDLLKATLKAPWDYFQTTDTGTMTNRFSQDMDLIDMKLPLWLVNTIANVALTIMKLILLCVVGKYMAITFPFLMATFVVIQFIYLRTSRQVRLLDIEAKAPLYAHFVETIDGITTMRAFGWHENFQRECIRRLNQSQRPFYMLLCLQQWLNLVLDLVIAAMAVVLMAIATSLGNQFSAGGMGVALNLVLSLNQILVHAIQSWTQLETSIGAVSRVHSFQKDTPCEATDMESAPAIQEWPTEGKVEFDNLTVTYQSTDQHPVLKNLTLNIHPGEKIAICGPSGSGKTSIIMALLQMTKIKNGSVTIDRRDLASIQPSDIRLRLNVIPQDPYFVPGTIRLNVDPHAVASDDEIVRAFKKVGLWKQIQTDGGLDGDLNASNWSMGERQLLALARALTSRSPILILDEATSNVDRETEAIMQEVIETEFANRTVIMVTHRLRYIARFDRVALIKNGELVECDSPAALLARESEFASFLGAFRGSG